MMVGPVTVLEALVALVVFAAFALLLKPRALRRLKRLVRRKLHAVRQSSTKRAKIRREGEAEFRAGQVISRIRTIDGDTIEDLDTRIRYRVANIDCPETEDRAGCYRERIKGEQAKGAAEIILSMARSVEVRPVGRIDRHGRTVAYLHVDGRDFGRLMIEKGFAVAWSGSRDSWCGEGGGLAMLARAASTTHACKTCGAGGARKPAKSAAPVDRKVVQLPVKFSRSDTPEN